MVKSTDRSALRVGSAAMATETEATLSPFAGSSTVELADTPRPSVVPEALAGTMASMANVASLPTASDGTVQATRVVPPVTSAAAQLQPAGSVASDGDSSAENTKANAAGEAAPGPALRTVAG